MTKGERVKLFRDLWPAACLANEWDIKDDTKRREVILECMELVRGPLVTTSSPEFGRDEVTALFCYLQHLADPADFDKAARWDTCLQDYRTYNRARQADWHERKLYGDKTNKLDRDRFNGEKNASGGPLDELDPDEVSKRHMSFAKRHQKKMSKEGKKQPKQAEMSLPESRQRQTTPQVPVTEEAPF
tara:strand:+ start:131 stop:691 length:561 start_codon:yes stop_codon:yes gene_type:complete